MQGVQVSIAVACSLPFSRSVYRIYNVQDVTTCQCHIESTHLVGVPLTSQGLPSILTAFTQGLFNKWLSFTPGAFNKLPKFVKQQKELVKTQAAEGKQTSITDHFGKADPKEVMIPYLDELFKQAASEWLIATDQVCRITSVLLFLLIYMEIYQPIQALEHQNFKK